MGEWALLAAALQRLRGDPDLYPRTLVYWGRPPLSMVRKNARSPSVHSSRTRQDGKRAASSSGSRNDRPCDLRRVSGELRRFALGFPGATEDFPWGERVAKVNGKIFVTLGPDPVPGGSMGLSVKLPLSGEEALDLPFSKPTGYGLGKADWVTASFGPDDRPPIEILKAWILESYRAVAPKKLLAALDRSRAEPE